MADGPGRSRAGRARAAALRPGVRAWPGWTPGAALQQAAGWIGARIGEEAEAGRFALWTPVAFGVGVAVYFAAANEPASWAACGVTAAAALGVAATRRGFLTAWLAVALLAGAGGFLAAKVATRRAEAPVLSGPLRGEAVGRAIAIEPRQQGRRRVTLALESLGGLPAERRPQLAQATIGAKPPLDVGDRVSMTAVWRPPDGPVRPSGYDFARIAYYAGVGATGLGAKDVRPLGPASNLGALDRLSAGLERLRADLTARIAGAVGGPEGTVAAALVTGVQGPIPTDVQDALRGAGLSHILSISGLHMALVAGTVFWLVRALLALVPRAALGWPIKGIAASLALAGATFYLALSGAEVATQRSYVMIAIAFLAIIVGRPALAPRNFALAALLVMAWTPEAMLGPSFQMSFAAVAGLVAWFETRRDRPAEPTPPTLAGRLGRRAAHWATLAVMTTLVAGLATAPFAAYHFQRVTPYAVVGNALSEPIIGFVVMPSVVGGLLFAPLGLDAIWWRIMGAGLQAVLAIARMVASWPGAERSVPAFGAGALILFAAGLAWLCLWRTALRWAAVPILGLALLLAAFPARPDVVIDPGGRFMAVRGPDGRLALLGTGAGASFAGKVWLAADGREPGEKAGGDTRCDAHGCLAPMAGGGFAALSWDYRALDEDCRRALLVVTRLDAPEGCDATAAVVDRRTLAATGALSLTRQGASFAGVAARDPAGDRPWGGPRRDEKPPDEALRLAFAPRAPPAVAPDVPVDPTDPPDEEAEPDDQ